MQYADFILSRILSENGFGSYEALKSAINEANNIEGWRDKKAAFNAIADKAPMLNVAPLYSVRYAELVELVDAEVEAYNHSMGKKFVFTLYDSVKRDQITGYVDASSNMGIALHFEGHGDCTSQDDCGTPVYIEKYDGDVSVRIYGDINSEDPTCNISLGGALLKERLADHDSSDQ